MGTFHRLMTFHGSFLLAELEQGHIAHGPCDAPGTVPAIVYRPPGSGRVLYLGADLPEGLLPVVRPLEPVGGIAPLTLSGAATEQGRFSVYSPASRLFLVAAYPDASSGMAHAIFAAVEAKAWETFTLADAGDTLVPASLSMACDLLDQVSRPEPTARSVLALIRDAPPAAPLAEVLNAAALTLTRTELADLAALVFADEDSIAKLKAIYPADLAAQHALGPLKRWVTAREQDGARVDVPRPVAPRKRGIARWLQSRPSATRTPMIAEPSLNAPALITIGPELDRLDTAGVHGTFVSVPHACNAHVRRHVTARKGACVLATARNEGRYILEWVAHHKALGFEHCFIYSNDNVDGSDLLLRTLSLAGEITWLKNVVAAGTRPQWKAYNHALQILPEILDYEWTLVIDLDECFELDYMVFDHVDAYLRWCQHGPVDAIALCWFVLGSNAETHWRDAPLTQRFPSKMLHAECGGSMSDYIKSLIRTNVFPVSMPHHPTPFMDEIFVYRSSSMKPYEWNPLLGPGRATKPDVSTAWIAHYFFKSNEEFLFKFARPRGTDKSGETSEFSALDANFVSSFVRNAQRHSPTSYSHPLQTRTNLVLARLLQHPGVRAAQMDISQYYASRLPDLVAKAALARGIIEAGEDGIAFMRPLLRALEMA